MGGRREPGSGQPDKTRFGSSRQGGSGRPGRGGQQRGSRAGRPASSQRDARPERARRTGQQAPPLPENVDGAELDRAVRAELATLAPANADLVARHLVMAARLLDDDPEEAYRHAVAARERAGRVGAVREAAGLTAYRAGRYAEALAELRAARRISGDQGMLAVMADCERGLGRPEKALEMAATEQARALPPNERAELLIVASGARRDLGQAAAAALMLQGPWLRSGRPWSARLFYAYADCLLAAGRQDEALDWFARAAEADEESETDAAERLEQLRR